MIDEIELMQTSDHSPSRIAATDQTFALSLALLPPHIVCTTGTTKPQSTLLRLVFQTHPNTGFGPFDKERLFIDFRLG